MTEDDSDTLRVAVYIRTFVCLSHALSFYLCVDGWKCAGISAFVCVSTICRPLHSTDVANSVLTSSSDVSVSVINSLEFSFRFS